MISRDPFQLLPFCDSVILSDSLTFYSNKSEVDENHDCFIKSAKMSSLQIVSSSQHCFKQQRQLCESPRAGLHCPGSADSTAATAEAG